MKVLGGYFAGPVFLGGLGYVLRRKRPVERENNSRNAEQGQHNQSGGNQPAAGRGTFCLRGLFYRGQLFTFFECARAEYDMGDRESG